MKNVFIINSHTTFLSALGTIQYLGLKEQTVLLLYMRNYSNSVINHPYEVVDITNFIDSFNSLYKSKKYRYFSIKKIDRFIDETIGELFNLYCPHLLHQVWQVIYTNKLCIQMSYIQEGGIPYKDYYITHPTLKTKFRLFITNVLYRMTKRIWHGGWYTYGTMKKQKELHSYAIDDVFFRYLPSINHRIVWPKVDLSYLVTSGSTIFVFDGFVKNGLCEESIYINHSKRLVSTLHGIKNYIKFHPAQSKYQKQAICDYMIKESINFQILPDDIPFELILSSSKQLKVVGFGSSLLYYAYNLGHSVVCKDDWLLESSLFSNYYKHTGLLRFCDYINMK